MLLMVSEDFQVNQTNNVCYRFQYSTQKEKIKFTAATNIFNDNLNEI